ncbi:hypothetical protein [Klebsiella michiganensis]|uniref:hypothetical protein n=1 Tax=Klebsiella michiganensis TaxID=1134687 RepID=UPI003F508DB8
MNVTDYALKEIIYARPNRLYRKGRCLYGADTPFRGLFVVMSGAIKHYRLSEEGMAPETISREIARLDKGEIIHFNSHFITIHSPEKLDAFILRE